MENDYYSSSAWALIGIHRSKPGTLTLEQGRLSFRDDEENTLFNVPTSEVSDLKFPWHYFGGGAHFTVGGEEYRISFVEPHNEWGLADGLAVAKDWKSLLTKHISS